MNGAGDILCKNHILYYFAKKIHVVPFILTMMGVWLFIGLWVLEDSEALKKSEKLRGSYPGCLWPL